jgi:prophage regulatory protein
MSTTSPKAHATAVREAYRMVDLKTIVDMTSLRRATIYAMVKEGAFPKPHQLGKRRIAWREADVIKWLQSWQAVEWAA